jgi:hypothetical protein
VPGIITSRSRRLYQRPPAGPYSLNKESPQTRGLVAWWPLGEGNLAGYQDYVQDSFPFTPTGCTIGTGPGGLAPSFGAATDRLQVEAAPSSVLPLSMAAWFFPTAVPATVTSSLVCVQSTAADTYLTMGLSTTPNAVGFSSVAATVVSAVGAKAVPLNVWSHMVAVFTSTTLRAVFFNGSDKGTNATSSAPTALTRTTVGLKNTTATARPHTGRIADVRIWNVALTDDEVWDLYDPQTRWDLYYPIGKKTFSFGGAGGTIYNILGGGGAVGGSSSDAVSSYAPGPSGGGAIGSGSQSLTSSAGQGGIATGPGAGARSTYAPGPSGGIGAGPPASYAWAASLAIVGGAGGGSQSSPAGSYGAAGSGGGLAGAVAVSLVRAVGSGGALAGPPSSSVWTATALPAGGSLAGAGGTTAAAYSPPPSGGGAGGSTGRAVLIATVSARGGDVAGSAADVFIQNASGTTYALAGQGGVAAGSAASSTYLAILSGGGAAGSQATRSVALATGGGAGGGSTSGAVVSAATFGGGTSGPSADVFITGTRITSDAGVADDAGALSALVAAGDTAAFAEPFFQLDATLSVVDAGTWTDDSIVDTAPLNLITTSDAGASVDVGSVLKSRRGLGPFEIVIGAGRRPPRFVQGSETF